MDIEFIQPPPGLTKNNFQKYNDNNYINEIAIFCVELVLNDNSYINEVAISCVELVLNDNNSCRNKKYKLNKNKTYKNQLYKK